MDCHILRLLHVDFNPFRLRAWCRRSKQERRWVELSGEMIQIKISRGRRRIKIPYELPLRFEHLKEQMGNYKSTRDIGGRRCRECIDFYSELFFPLSISP